MAESQNTAEQGWTTVISKASQAKAKKEEKPVTNSSAEKKEKLVTQEEWRREEEQRQLLEWERKCRDDFRCRNCGYKLHKKSHGPKACKVPAAQPCW